MIKRENYVVIQGWMITDYKLKGAELITFATIYGFSQSDEGGYSGGLAYLAEWTGSTTRTVIAAVKSLEEKGLIEKTYDTVRGVRVSRLRAVCEKISPPCENISLPCEKTSHEDVKNLHTGCEKISPNNYIDNTSKNTNKKERGSASPRFVPPTVEEVRAYCTERRNRVDPEAFVDFYASKGWKVGSQSMKDWKAAVRTWEKRDAERAKQKQEPKKPAGAFYRMDEHPHDAQSDADTEKALVRRRPSWAKE